MNGPLRLEVGGGDSWVGEEKTELRHNREKME